MLTLEIQKESSSEHMIFEPSIGLLHDWGHNVYNEGTYWSYSYLFKLFFQMIAIDKKKLYVQNNAIGGLLKSRCAFESHSKVIDERTKISIDFEPEFILELDGVKYKSDQIFVDISKFESKFELGNLPVRLKKLDDIKQSQVFTLCVQYNLNVSPYEAKPNTLLLQFTDRKPYLDYEKFFLEHFRQGGMIGVVNSLNNLNFSNLPLLEDQSWGEHSETPFKRLIKILHELGEWVITKITEINTLKILEISNNELKKAMVQGMCSRLFSSSLRGESLGLNTANIIAKIFSHKEFLELVDKNDFKEWLRKSDKEITENRDSISLMRPYLVAVFPIIKYYYDEPATLLQTKSSIALHNIAFSVLYDDLKLYMQSLEPRIPDYVRSRKWKHTGIINNYLRLYIRYPFVDNIKQNLLNAIKEEQEELLKKWVISPRFYYYPIDEHTIRLGDIFEDDDYSDDLILSSQDQQKLKYFFESTGCKVILLNMLDSESIEHTIYISALRWSIITQDPDLFNKILESLKQKTLDKRDDLMDDIKWYVPYLNYNDPIQHELLKVLGHLARTTEMEISLKVQKLDVVLWQKYQKVEDQKLRERDPYYLALIPYRAAR